jgi:hypothetical protein
VAHHELAAGLLNRADQPISLGEGCRKRNLAQDVLAGAKRALGLFGVHVGWGADYNHVHLGVAEDLVQVGGRDVHPELRGKGSGGLQVAAHDAVQLEIVIPGRLLQLEHGTGMHLRDGAVAEQHNVLTHLYTLLRQHPEREYTQPWVANTVRATPPKIMSRSSSRTWASRSIGSRKALLYPSRPETGG